jgi:hypothetical protein
MFKIHIGKDMHEVNECSYSIPQYFSLTNILQKSIKSIGKVDQVSPSTIYLVLH